MLMPQVDLPKLERLVLHSLESIMSIWDNNLHNDSFSTLTSIEIKACARISSIFRTHLVKRLRNLRNMRLLDLPKLGYVVMKSHEEEALSFPNLREVLVENCDSLTCLFPNAIARSLAELANMHISSCKGLEEVVSSNDEEGVITSTEAMSFYNLSSLQLEKLDSLVHFCAGNYELYFPFLKNLSIIGCAKLKTFVVRPPNLIEQEERLQEINSTSNIEIDFSSLFDEKVVFPNLEKLRIEELKVKEIWPNREPANFLVELKELEAENCQQLLTIVPSFMLNNMHNLEVLSLKSCNSVEVIFELEKHSSKRQKISRSKSTRKILEHLRKLTVSSCRSMQHIVAIRDDDHIGETYCKTVMFPQLSSLKLSKLPRLCTFCPENQEIELPLLALVEIDYCQSMEVLVADSNEDDMPFLLVEKVEFPRMVSMEISNMQKLRELWHISKESTHSECSSSSEAFCKLKLLKVENCKSLLTVFPSKMIRAFHNLEELSVKHCKSLESVFESPGSRREIESNNFNNDVVLSTFAMRKLHLWYLPQMKHVWNVEDPRWLYLSFVKLHFIFIRGCDSLRHLFPFAVAGSLHQLDTLVIDGCEEMEEIVWKEASAHNILEGRTPPVSTNLSPGMHFLEWPSMKGLRLQSCPKAKILASAQQNKVKIPKLKWMGFDASTLENQQFLEEIYAYPSPRELCLYEIESQAWVQSIPWFLLVKRFPDLRTLEIWDSDSTEIFSWDNEKERRKSGILNIAETITIGCCNQLTILPSYLTLFHNLKELEVRECNGFLHLVTSSVARALVQLTKLAVYECNMLEEIVTFDCDENGIRAKDNSDMVSFPLLKILWLYDLPSLRSFSSTSCNFNFPSLREVYLKNVPKMHVFCEGLFITPYKHRITRNVRALYNQEVKRWWMYPGSGEGI